jgi:hypothetical protein
MPQQPLPPHQTQPLPPVPQQFGAPVSRRSPLLGIGVIVAILLGATAMVISLTGVGRQSVQSTTATSASATPAAGGDTTEADRALCQAIAPLLKQSLQDGKDFVNLGYTGTPERDGGIADYKTKVDNWVGQVQPILDQHANPPRYLARMTQLFIDFTHSYADNIRPGPATDFDNAAWNNRVVAFGGPYEVCKKYGADW